MVMGMREKLIEILRKPIFPHELADPTEVVADYLLDNDVVPVIRCKDCKYWLKAKKFSPFGWCLQRVNDLAYVSYKDRMEPEDFCSKGERKDNEN